MTLKAKRTQKSFNLRVAMEQKKHFNTDAIQVYNY